MSLVDPWYLTVIIPLHRCFWHWLGDQHRVFNDRYENQPVVLVDHAWKFVIGDGDRYRQALIDGRVHVKSKPSHDIVCICNSTY